MISVDATEKWGGNFICTGLCQLCDVEEGGRGKVDCRLKERREKTERGNETKNKNRPLFFSSFSFSFPKNPIGTSFLSRDLLFPDFIAYSAFSFRGNAE